MKKIYSIVALLAVAFAANAQRPSTAGAPLSAPRSHSMTVQTVTDTLLPDADWTQQPTIYSSQNGGYVVGVNGYGDLQKVQIFRPGMGVTVEGAIYWFGAKEVGGNGNVAMRIYHIDGTGTSTAGTTTPCPNTTYVSDNVQMSNIDTSLTLAGAYVHTFSAPQWCGGDFAVGFSVAGCLPGDTIGLVSTQDPNSNTEDSWEQWGNDNSWHTMLEPNNWVLNIAFAIFPLVDASSGIETPYVSGVRMGFSGPNPTCDNTTLSYGLQNNAKNVVIRVLDAQGRIVTEQSLDNQVAGEYTYAINSSSYAAGTYYVQLQADNSRLAVKFVKN